MAEFENSQNAEIFCTDYREMDREYVRRRELEEIIKKSVQQALSEYNHKCLLNLSDEQIREVHNIFNAIKEVGHGNPDVGVERIRENHKMLDRYCEVTGRIGTTVITAVVLVVLSASSKLSPCFTSRPYSSMCFPTLSSVHL